MQFSCAESLFKGLHEICQLFLLPVKIGRPPE